MLFLTALQPYTNQKKTNDFFLLPFQLLNFQLTMLMNIGSMVQELSILNVEKLPLSKCGNIFTNSRVKSVAVLGKFCLKNYLQDFNMHL